MSEIFNGVITRVGIFPIKEEIKNQTVKKPGKYYGKQWNIDKTHTIAIKVDGLQVDGEDYTRWITIRHQKFKEGDELTFRIKSNGEWVDVWEGSTVLFFYAVNKGFVNIVDKDKFSLIKQGAKPEQTYTFNTKSEESGGNKPSSNFDQKGMMKGNAFNCAMILVDYNDKNKDIVKLGKQIYDINCNVQKQYPELNGASIGMAITNACHITKNIDLVEAMAVSLLHSYIKDIGAYVEAGKHDEEVAAPQNHPANDPDIPPIDDPEIPF